MRSTGRMLGVLYLTSALLAAFGLQYIPLAVVVPGDAAATAERIAQGQLLYRIAIASDLVSQVLWVFLIVGLYSLLRQVDPGQALAMLVLASLIVAIECVNVLNLIAPLILLSGATSLTVFSTAQLQAFALAALNVRASGLVVGSIFWGMWLFPFGALVIRSRMFPAVLGYLLFAAGAAYVVSAFAAIIAPPVGQSLSLLTLPIAAVGELSMVGWLLVRGVRAPATV